MRRVLLTIVAAASLPSLAQTGSGAIIPASRAASSPVVSCDCTSYPFKPNPPCFGSCVGKLASSTNPDFAAVKGLDPGVSVSIKVLAANPKKETIDFTGIRSKSDLEIAANKSLRSTDLIFDDATITTLVKAKFVEAKTVDAASIKVETLNGTVALSGFAKSAAEKSQAEYLARNTRGVREVRNSLTVSP